MNETNELKFLLGRSKVFAVIKFYLVPPNIFKKKKDEKRETNREKIMFVNIFLHSRMTEIGEKEDLIA